MLSDSITNWYNYDLGNTWKDLMSWLIKNANNLTPEGKYTIPYCTINIFPTVLRLEGSGLYESHKTMCDLHMVLEGEEYLWCRPTTNLEMEGRFNTEKDIGFYKATLNDDGTNRLKLTKDIWALIFPWDAHLPDISINNEHHLIIKKLVAKIPLSYLTISTKQISHGYF